MNAVSRDDIFQMDGTYPINKRTQVYQEKRVFFMTPQTLENDLECARFDGKNVVLVVVDEAHRATGNYSYCKII